jgi:DNA-binding transcriptional LysR family regulator
MALKSESVIDQMDALFQLNKSPDTQRVEGSVKITMPNSLGRQYLLPALTEFVKNYPGIQLDLRFSDLIDNVVADQMDIGVRIGFFGENRNVARRAREIKFYIVGTPELIAKCGIPYHVNDLCQMPHIGLIDQNTGRIWPWCFASEPDCLPTAPAFITDDPEAELEAV